MKNACFFGNNGRPVFSCIEFCIIQDIGIRVINGNGEIEGIPVKHAAVVMTVSTLFRLPVYKIVVTMPDLGE